MIDADQVAAYNRDGYLVVERVFDDAEIASIRAALDEVTDRSARAKYGSILEPEAIKDRQHTRVRRILNPAEQHETFARFMTDARLIRIIAQLIGPDFRRMRGKVNMKPARVGAPVEWHQDWAFYPHTNDDLITVSIFVDDITGENGPIMVIPGSHTGPVHSHHEDGRFVGLIAADAIRSLPDPLVPMTGPAGSVSFHHIRVVHGSPPNHSDMDRRMLVYPVAAADSWPLAGFRTTLEQSFGEMMSGMPSFTPRMKDIPLRMPYPNKKGSLFEIQKSAKGRYFL